MGNVVTATFTDETYARTEALWQYDYGQVLKFEGLTLPESYEVHFSDNPKGYSKAMLGDSTGVLIPDEYLLSGKTVYAWVYLHTGSDDGETEYSITIPVNKRSQPTNEAPTPQQRSVISQAISMLNTAVEECEGCVEHYPKIIEGYWYVWNPEQGQFVSTGVDAHGLRGEPGAVYVPDVSVNAVISWTNNGGLPNPEPVDITQAVHLDEYARISDVNNQVNILQGEINGKLDASQKGAANGVAVLDGNGKLSESQIPPYLDDVLEYGAVSQFPSTGEHAKLYISTSNNTVYRWTGVQYVAAGSTLALGETSTTAYRGDRGKYAYDHAVNKGGQFALGFNKIGTNADGHVTSVSAVTASDVESLGFAKATSGIAGSTGWYTPIYMNKLISSTSFSFTVPFSSSFAPGMVGVEVDIRVRQNYTEGTAAKGHYEAEFLYMNNAYTLNASDITMSGSMTSMNIEHASNVITVSFTTSLENNYGMARVTLYPRTA